MLRSFINLFVLISLIACSSEDGSRVDNAVHDQILHVGNATEPQDLDPYTVTGVPERRLGLTLFENLLTRDTATLEIKPAVAESWEISDDQLTYTFMLRSDAKWSNGEAVTANDFVYGWNRILHPRLVNEFAYVYYNILNAEKYNKGEITNFDLVGVKAINDYTLEFTLNRSNPLFLDMMIDNNTVPVHKATIEKHGEIWNRGTAWTRPENIVSNGPYRLTEWIPNKVISVVPNEYYWDRDRVKLNEIHFYPVDEHSTEERMFRNGQLHMTYEIPLEKIATYKKDNPEMLKIFPLYGTYFYLFNVTQAPFDDVRVREALSLVIDREQLVSNVTKGGEIAAYSLSPLDPNGYRSNTGTEFNIERAKQLLADAGYPDGEGFPEFELIYNTSEKHKIIALAIQQMWKTSLNINSLLTNQEWKVFLDNRKQLHFQVARAGSISTFGDPSDLLDSYTSGAGMNNTGWSNLEFDALMKKAKGTLNKEQRFSLFQQAETILINELPLIPLFYYNRAHLMSPDIKGWSENLLDYPSFKNVYLSSE